MLALSSFLLQALSTFALDALDEFIGQRLDAASSDVGLSFSDCGPQPFVLLSKHLLAGFAIKHHA